MSFGCYNTIEEVDHAANLLSRIAAGETDGDYEQDELSGEYWPRGYNPEYERYFVLQPGVKMQPHKSRMPRCGM
jgi:hypothetical protein